MDRLSPLLPTTHQDVVAITGLDVPCVVGLYPHERGVPQPLLIDVEMAFDTETAARTQRFGATLDYAAAASQIAFILQTCRFRMLETAAHALVRYLLLPPSASDERPPVVAAAVRLRKPLALASKGVPSVKVARTAEQVTFEREHKGFGTVDVILLTKTEGIYRLNVGPGRSIPLHVHRRMQESELVLHEGLLLNGKHVPAGSSHSWPHDLPHRYDNPTDRWRSILCIDSPPFVPEDEIEVEGSPGSIEPNAPFLPLFSVGS